MSGSIRSSRTTSGPSSRASARPVARRSRPGPGRSRAAAAAWATISAWSGSSSTIRAVAIVLALARSPRVATARRADRPHSVQLDHVRVVQLVVALDRLPLEDARAPDLRELQRLLEVAMDLPGQVQDRAPERDGERLRPIGRLAGDFRVDPYDTPSRSYAARRSVVQALPASAPRPARSGTAAPNHSRSTSSRSSAPSASSLLATSSVLTCWIVSSSTSKGSSPTSSVWASASRVEDRLGGVDQRRRRPGRRPGARRRPSGRGRAPTARGSRR